MANKDQKLMKAIALGKKLFNIFIYDLFFILKEIYFASYTDDNTPFVSEATPEYVVNSLESCSATLFEWLSNNQTVD